MTTGGIGREPGMLIRMRVVSVVSVLGSSGCGSAGAAALSSGASCVGCSDGYWRDPYGGVPEGYAAPPRPWGPEDELSVSRLKAGSPGWLHRPFLTSACSAAGGSAARTTILAAADRHPGTVESDIPPTVRAWSVQCLPTPWGRPTIGARSAACASGVPPEVRAVCDTLAPDRHTTVEEVPRVAVTCQVGRGRRPVARAAAGWRTSQQSPFRRA